MLLRFETPTQFLDYFNEEKNTVHITDTNEKYRFSGSIPKEFPVILQSGPAHLTNDTVFRAVNIQKDQMDERLVHEAKSRQMQQQNQYVMSM